MKKGLKLLPLLAMGLFTISSCGAKGYYESTYPNLKGVLYYPSRKEDVKDYNHAHQYATPKELDQMIAKYENEEGFERFHIDDFGSINYCFDCGNCSLGSLREEELCNKCHGVDIKEVSSDYDTIYLKDEIILRIYIPSI